MSRRRRTTKGMILGAGRLMGRIDCLGQRMDIAMGLKGFGMLMRMRIAMPMRKIMVRQGRKNMRVLRRMEILRKKKKLKMREKITARNILFNQFGKVEVELYPVNAACHKRKRNDDDDGGDEDEEDDDVVHYKRSECTVLHMKSDLDLLGSCSWLALLTGFVINALLVNDLVYLCLISFSMVLWELLTNSTPFKGRSTNMVAYAATMNRKPK
ncbi:Uncharacterized protein Fot_24634 [Forsythia ovata]|uniref:Uncharacterized protein n=1 Tax=Forsythia ovata TaxID=205694 RepID=A0ABD1U6R8_9LAMI